MNTFGQTIHEQMVRKLYGKHEVVQEPIAGAIAHAAHSRLEIGGVATHRHGDPPVRRGLMFTDANVSKPPSSRDVRRQVHADAPVEIEQKVVNGQIRERPVGNRELGVGDPFREQWSKLPVAQDAEGSFDVAGGRTRRASRSRIRASSTGSPSIAMELATWRGIAS